MELTERQKRLLLDAVDNMQRLINEQVPKYSEKERDGLYDLILEYDELAEELLKEA